MAKSSDKTDIWVYASWKGISTPLCMGVLSAHQAKGKKAFSFEYDKKWLQSQSQYLLDPDIGWYSGPQFPTRKENFGVFLDSMPDRWGRTLMRRRAAIEARNTGASIPKLYDIDFLLGVYDESRIGALRFKISPDGPFVNNNENYAVPPWSSIRTLQNAARKIEADDSETDVQKWLKILLAPGSSLGGARPKANIIDDNKQLWIAKFPSQNDAVDKGAWEYLAYKLALQAGIEMSPSKLENVIGKHHTFITKRFDRIGRERIHFASAMTMTGNDEGTIREKAEPPSYLEIAEFIQFAGANIQENLKQLWRRIVFNIMVSNTDDHLRNHGFILTKKGWVLSPAFDINPSIDKSGLSLCIDTEDNSLDLELARSVGFYFQLTAREMGETIKEVRSAVKTWSRVADEIGIPPSQQELMRPAFQL